MSHISPNIVIMTREELDARDRVTFQRGVNRGYYERLLKDGGVPDETDKPTALNGLAALMAMVDLIGEGTDHDVAKLLVDNELSLRQVVAIGLQHLAEAE